MTKRQLQGFRRPPRLWMSSNPKARRLRLPSWESLEDRVMLNGDGSWALPRILEVLEEGSQQISNLRQELADEAFAKDFPFVRETLTEALELADAIAEPFVQAFPPGTATEEQAEEFFLRQGFSTAELYLDQPEQGTNNVLELSWTRSSGVAAELSVGGETGIPYFDADTDENRAGFSGQLAGETALLDVDITFGVDIVDGNPRFFLQEDSYIEVAGVGGSASISGGFTIKELADVQAQATLNVDLGAKLVLQDPDGSGNPTEPGSDKLRLDDFDRPISEIVSSAITGSIGLNNVALSTKIFVLPELNWTGRWNVTATQTPFGVGNQSFRISTSGGVEAPSLSHVLGDFAKGFFDSVAEFNILGPVGQFLTDPLPFFDRSPADLLGISESVPDFLIGAGSVTPNDLLPGNVGSYLSNLGIIVLPGATGVDGVAGELLKLVQGERIDLLRYRGSGGKSGDLFEPLSIPLFAIGVPNVAAIQADLKLGIQGGWSWSATVGVDTGGFYILGDDPKTPQIEQATGLSVFVEPYAAVEGSAQLFGIELAKAGGAIGVRLQGEVYVVDPINSYSGDNGKAYLSEVFTGGQSFFQDFIDVLYVRISGSLTARVYAEVNLLFFSLRADILSVDVTLFELEIQPRALQVAQSDPFGGVVLKQGNTLVIRPNPQNDPLELGLDYRNGRTVVSNQFGYEQEFGGVSRVDFEGSSGDDLLEADSDFPLPISARGNAGSDTILGGAGPDWFRGQDGDDFLDARGGDDTLEAGNGNDTAYGGLGNDELYGFGEGVNQFFGGEGNDSMRAGTGRVVTRDEEFFDYSHNVWTTRKTDIYVGNMLDGGVGNDTVWGNNGRDTLKGGSGDDRLESGFERDTIEGGPGDDSIHSGADNDSVRSGAGDDIVRGGFGDDTLEGGSGDDLLIGQGDNDRIMGGSGADTLQGEDGDDMLAGETGDDSLRGGAGRDNLEGGLGKDELLGQGDNDILDGQLGIDTLRGGGQDDLLILTFEDDLPGQPDQLFGDAGRDLVVVVGHSINKIREFNRETRQFDDLGPDEASGNDDIAVFNANGDRSYTVRSQRTVLQRQPTENGGSDLVPVEETKYLRVSLSPSTELLMIDGGEGDDRIAVRPGVTNRIVLNGGAGNDTLIGGSGRDTIAGGPGNDSIEGGAGDDELRGEAFDSTDATALSQQSGFAFGVQGGSDDVEFDPETDGGDDTIHGGAGNDALYGQGGNDELRGGLDRDILEGGRGDDLLAGVDEDLFGDFQVGGAGADTLIGTRGDDVLVGGLGNDLLLGRASRDVIRGDNGEDTLLGESGQDVLFGDEGNDLIYTGNANEIVQSLGLEPLPQAQICQGTVVDVASGDGGQDTLHGSVLPDVLYGREGDDQIWYSRTPSNSATGCNHDQFRDIIDGGDGVDTFQIPATVEDDRIFVNYDGSLDRFVVTIGVGDGDPTDIQVGDEETIDAGERGIEVIGVDGLEGDDVIEVDTERNALFMVSLSGGPGNDLLDVGEYDHDKSGGFFGDVTLRGGEGNDTLIGGQGAFIDSDDATTLQDISVFIDSGPGTDVVSVTGGDANDALTAIPSTSIIPPTNAPIDIPTLNNVTRVIQDRDGISDNSGVFAWDYETLAIQGQAGDDIIDVPEPYSASLIENGGFESSGAPSNGVTTRFAGQTIGGWTVEEGSVDIIPESYWQSAGGIFSIDLDGDSPGTIFQELVTEEGEQYTLFYARSGNFEGGNRIPKIIEVFWNGQLVSSDTVVFTGQTNSNMLWRTVHIRNLIATGPSSEIRIRSTAVATSSHGPVLDEIRLIPQLPPDRSFHLSGGSGVDTLLLGNFDYVTTASSAVIRGGDDSDTIRIDTSVDQLFVDAGSGDDIIESGYWTEIINSTVLGGQGIDVFSIPSSPIEHSTFDGGLDDDRMTIGDFDGFTFELDVLGGPGHDEVLAEGNQVELLVDGGDGDDTLVVGDGPHATVLAGAGDDWVSIGGGANVIDGGPGDDSLRGGIGDDTILGREGNDVLEGGDRGTSERGNDVLLGGRGDDEIAGGYAWDLIDGGPGNDDIWGGPRFLDTPSSDSNALDTIFGGEGNDVIRGSKAPDIIFGGPGDDYIRGARFETEKSFDWIVGGAGSDDILGDEPSEVLDGHIDTINVGWKYAVLEDGQAYLLRPDLNQFVRVGRPGEPWEVLVRNAVDFLIDPEGKPIVWQAEASRLAFQTTFDEGVPGEFDGGILTGIQGYTVVDPLRPNDNIGETGFEYSAPYLESRFVGDFYRGGGTDENNTITLTLEDLPEHESIDLGFLLAVIDSWDGDRGAPFGPDGLRISVDGEEIFAETFSNLGSLNIPAEAFQSYQPNPGVWRTLPPAGEATGYILGFNNSYLDNAYDPRLDPQFQRIPHSSSTLTVEWSMYGDGVQDISDESFAIEDVTIRLNQSNSPGLTVEETEVITVYSGVESIIEDHLGQVYLLGSDGSLTRFAVDGPSNVANDVIGFQVGADGLITWQSEGANGTQRNVVRFDALNGSDPVEVAEDVVEFVANPVDNSILIRQENDRVFRYSGGGELSGLGNGITEGLKIGLDRLGGAVVLEANNRLYIESFGESGIIELGVADFAIDENGRLFVLTTSGVVRELSFNATNQVIQRSDPIHQQEVQSFQFDALGQLIAVLNDGTLDVDGRVWPLFANGSIVPVAEFEIERDGTWLILSDANVLHRFRNGMLDEIAVGVTTIARRPDGSFDQVAPRINGFEVTPQVAEIGTTVEVSGTITDFLPPGQSSEYGLSIHDSHTFVIEWGDETISEPITLPPGNLNFGFTHTYDDPDSEKNGTFRREITVQVTDNWGATASKVDAVVLTQGDLTVSIEGIPDGIVQFPIDQATIRFNEPVTGFNINDLRLTYYGESIPRSGLDLESTDGGLTWTLSGLAGLTESGGRYELLIRSNAGIEGAWTGRQLPASSRTTWNKQLSLTVDNADDPVVRLYESIYTVTADVEVNFPLRFQVEINGNFETQYDTRANPRATIEHEQTFLVSGLNEITFTVFDEFGNESDPVVLTIDVREVAIVNGDLRIGGTNLADEIEVRPSSTGLGLDVLIDEEIIESSLVPEGIIDVRTGFSNDRVVIDDGVLIGTLINVSWGDDTVFGGSGPDVIVGGLGLDVLNGLDGDDSIVGNADADTLIGGEGSDTLVGGDGNDLLQGFGGTDTILAGAGADSVSGGMGEDSIEGGAGADTLYGDANDDIVSGGGGPDEIYTGGGNDTAFGGDGQDLIAGGGGNDSIAGQGGNDSLRGNLGDDTIRGGDGADQIRGNVEDSDAADGDDSLLGESGHDTIWGDFGDDYIDGGVGNDSMIAGRNDDMIADLVGDNFVRAGDGEDTIITGNGHDTIEGNRFPDLIDAGHGNNVVDGGGNDDTITSGSGNDTLRGQFGDDYIDGGPGNDVILGGNSRDTILGRGGNDYLDGGNGFDSILGGSGNDTLVDGRERDTLVGGAGADTYRINHFASSSITELFRNNQGDHVLRRQSPSDGTILDVDVLRVDTLDLLLLFLNAGNDVLNASASFNGLRTEVDGGNGSDIANVAEEVAANFTLTNFED